MSLTPLRADLPEFLSPYLPVDREGRPFVTLTYAQSLDSRISKGPGIRTAISHIETKTMTHYLRFHHDGILIGTGTVIADNPGLNCKWVDENGAKKSPKPIIVDLEQKWRFKGSKMEDLYRLGQGHSPIVIVKGEPAVRETDVSYLIVEEDRINWDSLIARLHDQFDIHSIMIEGGARVINELLTRNDIVDSLVITIGSTFLGENGVQVSPPTSVELKDINWWKGTADSVLCARLK